MRLVQQHTDPRPLNVAPSGIAPRTAPAKRPIDTRARVVSTTVVCMNRDSSGDGASTLLRGACRQVGLDAEGARLIRLGSNAVFRLADPVIVRIASCGAGSVGARRSVRVARWLEKESYSAARVLAFEQPVIVNGHSVTFWREVSPSGSDWASAQQLGALLAELHALEPPRHLCLPRLAPFAAAEARIASSTWLTSENRSFLTGKLTELRRRFAGLDWELSTGVIHGDANIGNVLRDCDGKPVMIDLDDFAIGHREWDLVITATYCDSFGWHTREEYARFARAYGYDIMRWPGYPTLREVSEFLMVTWVITRAGESQCATAEAIKRIGSLRTAGSRRDWDPL